MVFPRSDQAYFYQNMYKQIKFWENTICFLEMSVLMECFDPGVDSIEDCLQCHVTKSHQRKSTFIRLVFFVFAYPLSC